MASILPGYNYDIFISYRHKDNKYDGWVTEFVQNLKKELDAIFKDDISIYFDFNPDDGLLETHNVDKSLEGKLNCLIFIPILSQTYCDPRSFAWEHEFRAFNKASKEDAFGRDIKLRNGNVASRILPIRVRELDEDDKKMLETELGSVLRPIDFIYKEQGVNRPLKPEDSEERNINKTKYRNQINKTANAIKEIISALKHKQSGAPEPVYAAAVEESAVEPEPLSQKKKAAKEKGKRSPWYYVRIFAGLIIACYFIFKDGKDNDINLSDDDEESSAIDTKSIAVLPFEDLSAAKDQEYFSDGISEEILNSLAQIKGLKVAGRTSSFQFKGQKTDLKTVGRKLNVSTVLEGSVRKSGNTVRITAQLINVKNGYHIWSEKFDREMTDIFAVQDEVANKIAKVLLKELAVTPPKTDRGTENVKAFEYYLEGKHINLHQFVSGGKPEDFKRAEDLFKKAITLDPDYALAHAGLADLYNTWTNRISPDTMYMRLQQEEIDKAIKLDPDNDYVQNSLAQVQMTKGDYDGAYKSLVRAVTINSKDANNLTALSTLLMRVGLLDEALVAIKHAIDLEPLETTNYVAEGSIEFQLGHFDTAIKILTEVEKQQPDNYAATFQLAYLYLLKKDLVTSKKYVDRCNQLIPQNKGRNGLDATWEAASGHKEEALKLNPDFRTYFILRMKPEATEGLLKLFSKSKPPLNSYINLKRGPFESFLGDVPSFRELMKQQEKIYNDNKAKYKLPDLDD